MSDSRAFAVLLGAAVLVASRVARRASRAMVDQPGPAGELIKLQWGAWLALAAAAAIVVAGRLGARGEAPAAALAAPVVPMGATPAGPTTPTATVWPPV